MCIVSGARSQEFHSPRHMCCGDLKIKVIWFDLQWSLPPLRTTCIASDSTAIEHGLIIHKLQSSVLCSHRMVRPEGPGQSTWRPSAAHSTGSPSRLHWLIPKERKALHLEPVWLQELPQRCRCRRINRLRGSTPAFSSGFNPEAILITGYLQGSGGLESGFTFP